MDSLDSTVTLISVCERIGITLEQVITHCAKRELVEKRQVVMYCLHKLCTPNFREIGKLVGRSHATVIYAVRKVDDFISIKDKRIIELVNKGLCREVEESAEQATASE